MQVIESDISCRVNIVLSGLSVDRNNHSICHEERVGTSLGQIKQVLWVSPPAGHVAGGENLSCDHTYGKLFVHSLTIYYYK